MTKKRFKGGGEIPDIKTPIDTTTVRIIGGSGHSALRPTCFDAPETGVKISKKLTAFDQRIYMMLSSLYSDGETTLTTARIYDALGYSGDPDAKFAKKIETSLKKLHAANVTINVAHEAGEGLTRYEYKGSLLPFLRVGTSAGGALDKMEIRLLCVSPLTVCARELGRVTAIPREAFSELSKTDPDFRLENYLMARISRMRVPNMDASREISFADILKSCKKDARKPKSPARKKIKPYLNHYKECGWIAGYSEEEDGFTIQLPLEHAQ